MMSFKRAGLPAFSLLALALLLVAPQAGAVTYTYSGEIVFCSTTCNSFGALGGVDGMSDNTTNSIVVGSIDLPIDMNGSFSFTAGDNIPFAFTITTSAIPEAPPVFFDGVNPTDCPPPQQVGQLCNPTTVNPLPLDGTVATVAGSGSVDANGNFISGVLNVVFVVPPFSNNGAIVDFDLTDGSAEGFVFGVVPFTRLTGTFLAPPGVIDVDPVSVSFPDTPLDDTAPLAPVTVTNLGDGNLTIDSVATIDPLAGPFSIATDGCTGMTLALSESCVIEVNFTPTLMGGAVADSFDIVSTDLVTPSVTVDVSGTGLEPNIQVTPSPLNFVATTVGEFSRAVATVTNTGQAPLVIETIDFSMLASQFSAALDNCSMMTLVPDASCTVTMEFAPAGEGVFMTGFVFATNDPDTPDLNYELAGEGIIGTVAALTVSPTSLTFDQILVGEMSSLAIQVNSTGNDPLTVNSITLSDMVDFSQSSDCPGSLPSGQFCTIDVVFTPLSGGAKTTTLTIDSNANNTPIVDVGITANAFDGPRIVVDPTTLDFGSPSAPVDIGNSATADVTVSNTGSSDLNVGTLSIFDVTRGGPLSTEFMVDNNGCATPVAPMGSCTITVAFTPLTDADKMAELVISSDDVDTPNVPVALTGYVFRGARVDLPQTSIDIDGGAQIAVGETAAFDLVISNSGTQDLDITGFSLDGNNPDQFSFTDTCVGTPVVPQDNCVVTVTFAPTSGGEKTAELSILSNDVTLVRAATIVVLLSGTSPVIQPPAAGSQTVPPPPFALADPGGGALGVGLLGLGLILLIARRRYR